LELSVTNILGGWHSVLARATDNDGLTTVSTVVSFFIERSEDANLPVPAQFVAQAASATEIQLTWLPLPTNTPAASVLVERWNPDLSAWIEIGSMPTRISLRKPAIATAPLPRTTKSIAPHTRRKPRQPPGRWSRIIR
jgi:hypothetical protein